jgi:ribosome-binding protein aMBF1 (putative translation factor)
VVARRRKAQKNAPLPGVADIEVGRRIRLRRRGKGISQTELAGHLGLSFQQVQKGENLVDLMDALKKSIANDAQPAKGKKPRKAAAGQKEMLLPISGKRAVKEEKKKVEKPTPARARKRA